MLIRWALYRYHFYCPLLDNMKKLLGVRLSRVVDDGEEKEES